MQVDTQELEKRIELFVKLCQQAGMSLTHQRMEIYRELAVTTEHPDARTIYERVRRRVPEISLDTVYRTLRRLEAEDIISRVGFIGESTRYEADTSPHHHFICAVCGLVRDIPSEQLQGVPEIVSSVGWGIVNSIRVEFRGICKTCHRDQEATE